MLLHLLEPPPVVTGTRPRENYVAIFTFILTLQAKTFDLGAGNTAFTTCYIFTTQSSLSLA